MNGLLVLGLVAAAAAPDSALPRGVVDLGTYKVYQGSRPLGTETFEFDSRGDSTAIFSHVKQVLPGPVGDLPIDKTALVVVGSLDYDLRSYQSTIKVRGIKDTSVVKDLTRGLVVNDTAFTAYRESSTFGGTGDRYARPAGRFFVLDAQVFVLFDLMCRDLARRSFSQRKVGVIMLRDDEDLVTSITATNVGDETIRWSARPVQARHMRFTDSYTTFDAWVHPRGYMLRLEQGSSGLKVEREPSPAVKRKAEPTPH